MYTYLSIAYIIVYLCLRVHCACTYTCIHLSIMYLYTYVYAKALAGGPRKTTIECVQEVYILFPKNSIFFAHAIYMLNRKEILNCGLSPYELHFGCRRMNPKIVWSWEISVKYWLYRILMSHNNISIRWGNMLHYTLSNLASFTSHLKSKCPSTLFPSYLCIIRTKLQSSKAASRGATST